MSRFTTVRYGQMRVRGLFRVDAKEELDAGDRCVVHTPRGYEMGTVLARPVRLESGTGCGSSACGSCASPKGEVLRLASSEDSDAYDETSRVGTGQELRYARQRSRDLGLKVKVADAEYLLRREKLVFHFTAEQRIDFRELVQDLGKRFKTRVEMAQVGARDEARLVGDMASCGQELCCRSFLHDLQPVSMRMAKQQKKTLDPTKIKINIATG